MSYCTQSELTERYGGFTLVRLTDRAATPTGVVDGTVIARALSDTDALIDGYIARRYALPVTPAQPILRDCALAIAIWKLHISEPDPKIEADYREAVRTLQRIGEGSIALTAAGVAAGETGGSGVQFEDRARDFTPDNMTGFI